MCLRLDLTLKHDRDELANSDVIIASDLSMTKYIFVVDYIAINNYYSYYYRPI